MASLDDHIFQAIIRKFRAAPRLLKSFSPRPFHGDCYSSEQRSAPKNPQGNQQRPGTYICGRIEAHDIACLHEKMMHPEPLAQIGPVLTVALNATYPSHHPQQRKLLHDQPVRKRNCTYHVPINAKSSILSGRHSYPSPTAGALSIKRTVARPVSTTLIVTGPTCVQILAKSNACFGHLSNCRHLFMDLPPFSLEF